jgi:hypothetical protein
MSGVHNQIAEEALRALPSQARAVYEPFLEELLKSSWYPDVFANRAMSHAAKIKIDPEADRFIYPDPPRSARYKRILKLTEKEEEQGCSPLRQLYLAEHYLESAVASLRAGDARSATKFCGVFSHTIGDIGEPIHAMNPALVDLVLPPPRRFIGFELHAGIEGLKGPVDLAGYRPKMLGSDTKQALAALYIALVALRDLGSAQVIPITQLMYAGQRRKATVLSSIAQNGSAQLTADFMFTVYRLAKGRASKPRRFDLRTYPAVSCNVDMLYRYRPMVDLSLIPYSGGKSHPLALPGAKGQPIEKVRGLSLIPYLGPPYTPDHHRETSVEFYLPPDACRTFRARVGVNPLFRDSSGAAVFSVLGDGRELYRSPRVKPGDAPRPVEVDLAGVTWLTLSLHYAPNPSSKTIASDPSCGWAIHGVWAEPELL